MKTMTKIATLAILAVAPLNAAFAADTATTAISASATVPNTCYINSIASASLPGTASFTPANQPGVNTTATLAYGDSLVNTTTAVATQQAATFTINAYCNYATSQIQLSSSNNGLTGPSTTAVGTFERRVNYEAVLSGFGGASTTLTTNGAVANNTAAAINSTAASAAAAVNANNIALSITSAAGTAPLISGAYADTLTVRFGVSI